MRREYTSAMRLRPLLLHALLSLALVANGMSGAMASVHAACAHDAVAAAVSAVEVPAAEAPAAEAPCHEDMGTETSSAAIGMDDQDKSQHASTPYDEGCGDCADHCQCACIAHGFAALMPPAWLVAASTGIRYAPATSYAHRAPTLPHPVRPPIG
jgi:hypothetical protein